MQITRARPPAPRKGKPMAIISRRISRWLEKMAGALALTPATPSQPTPAPALAPQADAGSTITLFGTVCATAPGTQRRDKRSEHAFARAEKRAARIDVTGQTAAAQGLWQAGRLKMDKGLRRRPAGDQRRRLAEARVSLGPPLRRFAQIAPRFGAAHRRMPPLAQPGGDPGAGIDARANARADVWAVGQARPAREADEGPALLDALPRAAQTRRRDQAVDGAPRAGATPPQMIGLMAGGHAEQQAARTDAARTDATRADATRADPARGHRLLADRSARRASSIERGPDGRGAVFLAVGASHRAGAGNGQDLPAPRGHAAKRAGR